MISKLAKGTACFFVDNKIIEVEDSEVYAYGIELLLSTIFNLIIAIIIALISNEFIPCVINLTAFVTIRMYAGGYHALGMYADTCVCTFCFYFNNKDF